MDFLLYALERAIGFGVASAPLILVFLLLKVFKFSSKSIAICLLLNLFVSVFFWVKLKDIHIALYQSFPYVSSFIWIWADSELKKRREQNKSIDDDFSTQN